MSRTGINIDDDLIERVLRLYALVTKGTSRRLLDAVTVVGHSLIPEQFGNRAG